MAWSDMVILETPGIDSSDIKGFVQSVDLPSALVWIEAAVLRTRAPVETAANAGGYAAQLKAVRSAMDAVRSVYRSLNLSWISDPVAAQIWHAMWGNYSPSDPSPICTTQTLGPLAVMTGEPWGPRLAHGIDPAGVEGMAWRAKYPATVPAVKSRLHDAWVAIKGPLPTTRTEVFNAARYAYAREVERAQETGQPVPPPPADLPAAVFQDVEVFAPVVVSPAFLDYQSNARLLDTSNRANGLPTQRFDGIFTGAGCMGGPPVEPLPVNVNLPNRDLIDLRTPPARQLGATSAYVTAYGIPPERQLGAVVAVEVPRDTTTWSWNCFRWDDAPGQRLRMVPPLRWAFEWCRAMADQLRRRGPHNIVMESRVNQILTNLERAKEFAEGELQGFDEALYTTLKENRALVFNAAQDRAILSAAASSVCGTAALAGGAPGMFCAGAAAAVDALLGLLPRAVGCWVDEWGQILPSALRAQISMDVPPPWTVTPPDDVFLAEGNLPRFAEGDVPLPIKVARQSVGPTEIEIFGRLPKDDVPPPPATPPPATPPPTQSSGGGFAMAAAATIAAVVAFRRKRKSK